MLSETHECWRANIRVILLTTLVHIHKTPAYVQALKASLGSLMFMHVIFEGGWD